MSKVQPRDYQVLARDAILASWGEHPWYKEGEIYRTVLCNLATSGGKTVISGMVAEAVAGRGRFLYIADTDELCDQPLKKFYKQFGIHADVEKAGDRCSMMADVVIGSAQTLCRENRLRRFPNDHFKYIVVDEAHRGSDRNRAIYGYFEKAKVVGNTATAFRAKLKDLSDFYEFVAFEMGVFDLIGEGYITPLSVLSLPVEVDLRSVRQRTTTEGRDYDQRDVAREITPYFEKIADLILEHAPNRHIVAFNGLIETSQHFVEVCRNRGINARHVDGQSPDRKQLLEGFERGDFSLISCSSLLTTGWDCPTADCLLNMAPTQSPGLFRQKVGRIGRVLPGVIDGVTDKDERIRAIAASAKPNALILDLLWQTEKFGLQGPTDLIAGNEQEARAIKKKIEAGGEMNLQAVAGVVQAEREAALKEELEAARKRRSAFTDSINLIAARLHWKEVIDFEPVSKWHADPISEGQRKFLEKQGIDPESARNRGHVSAFMNLLFGRKQAGLCSHYVVAALEAKNVVGAVSFTDAQAYRVLQGDYPFPFGKHGPPNPKLLRQIPDGYWRWLADQSWAKQWPVIYEYMKEMGYVGTGQVSIKPRPSEPLVPLSWGATRPVRLDVVNSDDDEIPF